MLKIDADKNLKQTATLTAV